MTIIQDLLVIFLSHKNEALTKFKHLCKRIQIEKGYLLTSIRSDHGGEFENLEFKKFCNENSITHNFSSLRIPQQNGVVERKNHTFIDIVRIILCENNLPRYFWAEVVNTTCYITNRTMIRPILQKLHMSCTKVKSQ